MEQRCVIHFLHLKKYTSAQIYQELLIVYGQEALALSSVKYWKKQFKLGRTCLEDAPRSGRPQEIFLTDFVSKLLNKDPYLSAHQISKKLNISVHTVINILTDDLGLNYRHLRWVPHMLTPEIKQIRVAQCKVILEALETAKRSHFNGIITGDESWFLYYYQNEHRWVLKSEDPGEIVAPTNYQRKNMISIYISKTGNFLIDIMPEGMKFNSLYFCNMIIPQLVDFAYPNGKKAGQKNWILHFDNAPSHKSKLSMETLKKFPFRILPNPIYSPDVAPLDFGIFGTVKEKMPNATFDDPEELKEQITEILNELGPAYIKQLFETWEERLREVIRSGGEYIH